VYDLSCKFCPFKSKNKRKERNYNIFQKRGIITLKKYVNVEKVIPIKRFSRKK
jgi:hypothetical protein